MRIVGDGAWSFCGHEALLFQRIRLEMARHHVELHLAGSWIVDEFGKAEPFHFLPSRCFGELLHRTDDFRVLHPLSISRPDDIEAENPVLALASQTSPFKPRHADFSF